MSTDIIYCDSPVADWHIKQCATGLLQTTDLTEFLNTPSTKKYAIFHVPFPYETGAGAAFEDRVNQILNVCDKIIILISELHDSTIGFVQRFQHDHIKYFVCGAFNFNCPYNLWMDWFATSRYFYKTNNVKPLDRLLPFEPKPKTFDILLGMPKPHRSIIYNYITEHNLNDQVIMTYLGHPNRIVEGENNPGWIWEDDGLEIIDKELRWTVGQVRYYGQRMSLSQVVPIKVYNQTAYSVVAETNFSNHYSFYTEKIVKPILGRRLFIVFSGQYYLKNLRNMGFKTFDGIIDESYDLEADFVTRGNMITKQMDYLFSQPQDQILTQIKPIVDHNYELLMNTLWQENTNINLSSIIGTT